MPSAAISRDQYNAAFNLVSTLIHKTYEVKPNESLDEMLKRTHAVTTFCRKLALYHASPSPARLRNVGRAKIECMELGLPNPDYDASVPSAWFGNVECRPDLFIL